MKSILEIKNMSYVDISSLSNAKKSVEGFGCEWKDWYYEKAKAPKSFVEDIRFWYSEGKSRIEVVPVSMIVGQDHDRYSLRQEDPRWITLLQDMGDRWKKTEPTDVIKDIENNNCGNNPVELSKYGNYYFISQGIHRTVHAKFLEMETMRCSVTEYIYDGISYSYYLRLSKIVGKETFDEHKCFTNIQKINFCWNNLYFDIGFNEACIGEFERQVSKLNSIMCSPIKKAYYKLKYIIQANPENHFEIMDKKATKKTDILTSLVWWSLKGKLGQALFALMKQRVRFLFHRLVLFAIRQRQD